MNVNAQNELYAIKRELQSIINELYDISYGVRKDFSGIGNDVCASSIARAAKYYEDVKYKLEKIDTSKVNEVEEV